MWQPFVFYAVRTAKRQPEGGRTKHYRSRPQVKTGAWGAGIIIVAGSGDGLADQWQADLESSVA
jgi:hypothetical protein